MNCMACGKVQDDDFENLPKQSTRKETSIMLFAI